MERLPHERWPWLTPVLVAFGLFVAFLANGRMSGAGDTVPATYLTVALVRGDGPVLDRFDGLLRESDSRLPGYATDARGHAVSRYPIGPALVAAPLVAPQVWWLDATRPGWERDAVLARLACERMAKTAAAAIVALTAAVMVLVLRGVGLGQVAVPAVLVVALGSDDASTASQALWQHGPAELCLALALLLLTKGERRTPARLAAAGFVTALMVVCRPIDLVFAAAVGLWVLAHEDRRERWTFFAPALAVAAFQCTYNVWFFDTLTGGYAAIEKMHPWAHGTKGTWTAPFFEGAAGTLLSPSHGLFVYCPWVALALALLPWSVSRIGPAASLPRWLLWALAVNFVLLSKYSCWWGGHCFGPRFWIDANPLLALILAAGLDWTRDRCRPLLAGFALTAAVAVAFQTVGFLCYPSSWHGSPSNADRHHERLWDWRDSELTRCWREGIRPRAW